jgi:hypothetical protein
VSGVQAGEALRSLPEDTRRGISELVSDHGAGAREHLAYQAMGEWTPDEREALRTLAAATPDVRAEAIDDVLGDGHHRDPVARTDGAPSHTTVHEQSGGGTIDAGPEPPARPAERHDPGAGETNGDGMTVAPSTPTPQPARPAGRDGRGAPAPHEQRATDPDTRFPGGQGGEPT